MSTPNDTTDATSALRQRFLTADEVYVYKIPPLKNAGGHRAEDWDLSNPLKTCQLLVERRGDALVLEFTAENTLFCFAQVDVTKGQRVDRWLEQVVDSSRYFSVKIQGAGGREALIGFGFRDREKATDLRECLQQYERSLQREQEASVKAPEFHLPTLAKGEKIHVGKDGKTTIVKEEQRKTNAVPLLKKKPPSAATEDKPPAAQPAPAPSQAPVNPKTIDKVAISMGDIDLEKDHAAQDYDTGAGDTSEGAVFEGDEDEWATAFDVK